ncbi:hypothetical protein FSO04_23775 [Paraburkholderia madseniana]|uniref:Uncharacterized protein n=1 Tax=Paraburkholderia madseniana TaxID=2599607 RepID=A0A6N6WA26_9BURK|nr:M23 family metallopeptidase [Paraburkholderia madseniana]KAE8757515.1 hypothetical protein FSO04_23775 [Paraburkholderia madseniana]
MDKFLEFDALTTMIISPPFLPEAGINSNDANATDPMMDAVDKFELAHGIYPIAFDRRWHPGMHLAPRLQNEKVRAIADGEVVAYRVCQHAFDGGGGVRDSNAGFVLLKHTTDTDEGRKLTFYSLYMHLLELDGYNDHGFHPNVLPLFLRTASPGPNMQPPVVAPAQPGGGRKIYRKDILGLTGRCHGQFHMHFEIFMTKPDFDAYFGATQLGREQVVTPTTTDYWGSSYYVIPPQQQFLPLPPGTDANKKLHGIRFEQLDVGQNSDTLYVEVWFHKGAKFTKVWRDAGGGRLELLTEQPLREQNYEYDLYKRATALYATCPSDGYELLRFGRILSTPTTLPEAALTTWAQVAFAAGRKGYIDVNNRAVLKLSDADFPFFKGWKKISDGNGPFNAAGLCDIDALKKILKDAKHHETPQEAVQTEEYQKEDVLVRYVKTTDGVREQLRGFVCEAPSEWDSTHNEDRYRKLKDPGEFYAGNDAGYTKFINLLRSFQFWECTGLPAGEKLWFFHPTAFIRHFRRCGWLTGNELAKAFPPAALRSLPHSQWTSEQVVPQRTTIDSHGPALNQAMRRFGVTTPLRQAAFLGNAMQETQWFRLLEEQGADHRRYYPWTGRGFLQLTWPDNYVRYWRFRGHQVDQALASRLHEAARVADQAGNNAALVAADVNVSAEMKEWRNIVGTRQFEASDSAGAYWAWSDATKFADKIPVMRRETKQVGNTVKPYYSCDSFGQVAATVNAGYPSFSLSSVNGLTARYQAYTAALVALMDLTRFPAANGTTQFTPDW